jgi:hypothetical protein
MQTKHIFSIFSGSFYEIPEKDLKILDSGQFPLIEKYKGNCKKCYGRGYTGRDKNTLGYNICNCIRKQIDFDCAKQLLTESQKIN